MLNSSSFRRIDEQFPPSMEVARALCAELHGILFAPNGEDEDIHDKRFGTPADPDQLYKPMLAAFDDAIAKLKVSFSFLLLLSSMVALIMALSCRVPRGLSSDDCACRHVTTSSTRGKDGLRPTGEEGG